ncbi:hypothetical protein [Methylobacterium sp. AMS5]|uniref:hypothetical protein n=1 Tax=Methylobacterium sp. AMS5 TaxID=925818 RepID=UPI00074F9844|nr:hypothetical protein [Methylobacterium sp. AMS5]AMB48359.1 hypothetical protein Y590_25660 [Methylobacterium sp. AMS5]
MARYQIEVFETRGVRCLYEVDADTPEDAAELAQEGETVGSTELSEEVIGRTIAGTPKLIEDKP